MRTTLNIDDDVLDHAKAVAESLHAPLRRVVNEALRSGLSALEQQRHQARPYRTDPRKMGLKPGRSLDNVQELLAQVEAEDYR